MGKNIQNSPELKKKKKWEGGGYLPNHVIKKYFKIIEL